MLYCYSFTFSVGGIVLNKNIIKESNRNSVTKAVVRKLRGVKGLQGGHKYMAVHTVGNRAVFFSLRCFSHLLLRHFGL